MKHKQHNKNKATAALLAGTLALGILTGCAQDVSEPVVTQDDLTPASAAQTALQQEAGGDRTYAYFWPAEDPQRAKEWAQNEVEEQIRELFEDPAYADEEARALLKQRQQEAVQSLLSDWEAERQLTPVVSAQEAANLAGRAAEQVYGIDLSGKELKLKLVQIYHGSTSAQAGQPKGMIWHVTERGQSRFFCNINAETAAYEQTDYDEDLAEAEKTPRASCSYPLGGKGEYWVWDTESPEFEPLIQNMLNEASVALSGSLLVGGAQVTEAKYQPRPGEEKEPDRLVFRLTCDNGQDYYLIGYRIKFYPEYNFAGCPLRGYKFYASDPFNVSD